VPSFDGVILKWGITPMCRSWAGNYCKHHTVLLSQLPFRLRDSLAARWPDSGTLMLLAKSSICGNRTANKRHQAGVQARIKIGLSVLVDTVLDVSLH
jgi:hypothetical protein